MDKPFERSMRFMGFPIYVTGYYDEEYRVQVESGTTLDGSDIFEVLDSSEIELLEDAIGCDLYDEDFLPSPA